MRSFHRNYALRILFPPLRCNMTTFPSANPDEAFSHSPLLYLPSYLRRRASRSDSKRHRISSSRTGRMLATAHFFRGGQIVPGPLTLRMIERVVSSINSTRTCVTPPREPGFRLLDLPYTRASRSCGILRTSSSKDSGHLDQFDGNFR
jgi:hypothetical protein